MTTCCYCEGAVAPHPVADRDHCENGCLDACEVCGNEMGDDATAAGVARCAACDAPVHFDCLDAEGECGQIGGTPEEPCFGCTEKAMHLRDWNEGRAEDAEWARYYDRLERERETR